MRRTALVAFVFLLSGCFAPQRDPNPSFNVSLESSTLDLERMRADPKPAQRPVLIVSGIADPSISTDAIFSAIAPTLMEPSLIKVDFLGTTTFPQARAALLQATRDGLHLGAEDAIPEVDVVAFSMGGLVARDAAMHEHGTERLLIRHLYTISTPHAGARVAGIPFGFPQSEDMQITSDFIVQLDEALPDACYELRCYAVTDDVTVGEEFAASPQHRKPKGDLYKDLADALGVSLQVKEMRYDKANWMPADMPLESVLDRLEAKGVRSATVEMLTREDSLLNGVVRFALSFASKLPDFKRVVIEALGSAGSGASNRADPRAGREEAKDEMSVIIGERNRAVLELLRSTLDSDSPPSSIAIFYGAAHMPQFDEKLVSEFGLTRVDSSYRWFRAMEVGEVSRETLRAQAVAAAAAWCAAESWTIESKTKKPSPKRVAALQRRAAHFAWRLEATKTDALFAP